jgi:uncharacterized protein (DUF1810 family)
LKPQDGTLRVALPCGCDPPWSPGNVACDEQSSRKGDSMGDDFNLERFVEAQDAVYPAVLEELEAGKKRSHWMWFVFPQVRGLGGSLMAERFAISSLDEAKAYLEHPILGPRLEECTRLVLAVEGKGAEEIFGYPDYLKFRSCMTLFAECTADAGVFTGSLQKFYDGEPDQLTLGVLDRMR